MKALKTLGILLLLLLVLGLIASLILPKEMKIERSITIDADAEIVWKHISTHKAFDKWSPWNNMDSNMTKEIIGEDGVVGATWKWSSDHKEVGNGEQEFTVIDRESGMVETALRVEGMGESKSWRSISVGDDGVTVTWGMHNPDIGIPTNLFIFLFGVEKSLEKLFDEGLNDLKTICEQDKGESPVKPGTEYEVEETTFPTTSYLGQRQIVKWVDMKTHMGTLLPAMYAVAKDKIAGPASALYWVWDVENEEASMTAALPVSTTDSMEGFSNYTIDSGKCLVINYYGSYEKLGTAHEWMAYHIATNKLEYGGDAVIEQYITDPTTEADTSKWHSKVIYFIK
jgi:effector-binding domain-containing protein